MSAKDIVLVPITREEASACMRHWHYSQKAYVKSVRHALEGEASKCYESIVKKKPDLQTLTPRVTREEHEILLRWADGRPLARMIIKAALKAAAESEKKA